MVSSSDTSRVTPMQIGGRVVRERERLQGMSAEERAWRAQWIKDQILTEREPVHVTQFDTAIRNPIRRAYQWPLNQFLLKPLAPIVGKETAIATRYLTGKILMLLAGVYAGAYYFKYNQNDWTRNGGWRVIHSRKICLPGDPGYPRASERTKPEDYADRGFTASPI